MIDGCNNEAVIGEGLGGGGIYKKRGTLPMRIGDQRQMVSCERAVFHPRQYVTTDTKLSRFFGAGIPDYAMNRRATGVGGNIDRSKAGSLRHRRRRREAEADGGKEFADVIGSVHRLRPMCCAGAA